MSHIVEKAKNYVADKVAAIKKPEANLSDVSVKKVNRDSATFNSQINVSNPYGNDIPIGEISYSLKSAGREIASGTIPDPGSITANHTTALDIPVKVPYDIMVSLARDIGKDWDIDYQLDVDLSMQIPVLGKITIPLSTKGEMKLPTLADIF